MASFDFFSQPQGPTVPISLFGDATSAGINAGKALPTALTAGIQGALQGVENTVKLTQAGQQIQMAQNTIEQQPTMNALRQEQLEAAQINNDINGLERDIVVNNQDLVTRQKRAELEAKAISTENELTAVIRRDDITEMLKSNDPAEKLKIIEDPRFQQTLLDDPKFAEGVMGQLYPLMNEEQRSNASAALSFSKQRQYDTEISKANIKSKGDAEGRMSKAYDALQSSPAFQYVMQDIKNPSDIQASVQVFPKGVKQTVTDEKGNTTIVPDTADVPQSEVDAGKFTVYKNGKKILDVNGEEAKKFYSFTQAQNEHKQLLRGDIFGEQIGAPSQPKPRQDATQSTGGPPAASSVPVLSRQQTPTTPTQGSVSGNNQIVQQARQNFANLARNPPSGISMGTLDERLRARKEAIRAGTSQIQQARVNQQAVNTTTQNLAAANASEPTQAPQALPPTPSDALSAVVKAPVKLGVEKEIRVPATVARTIQSDPLLSRQTPLIQGLAAVESAGKRGATSPTGVVGLLQVTKSTAAIYGLNRDIPEENVKAGMLYLNDNLLRFNGNLHLALAAYNAGPGNISDAITATQSTDWPTIKAHLKGTLSARKFKEVSEYPDRVISSATQFMGRGGEGDNGLVKLLQDNNLIIPQGESSGVPVGPAPAIEPTPGPMTMVAAAPAPGAMPQPAPAPTPVGA